MTEPMRTGGAAPPEAAPAPEPEVVQWGSSERPSRLRLLADPAWRGWQGWRDQRFAWVLAALGGLALFGSMIDEWQVTSLPGGFFGEEQQEITSDLASLGAWGFAWMVAVTALAAGTGLAVFGSTALRPAARGVGLAIAGALAGLLVVMTISLTRRSVLDALAPGNELELEPTIGRGVYVAYLGLLLAAGAIWWVRPVPRAALAGPVDPPDAVAAPVVAPRQPGPDHAGPDSPGPNHAGPADLRVGPAEPFTQLGPASEDDQRWRRPGVGGG